MLLFFGEGGKHQVDSPCALFLLDVSLPPVSKTSFQTLKNPTSQIGKPLSKIQSQSRGWEALGGWGIAHLILT
jgi:hypothetical protein